MLSLSIDATDDVEQDRFLRIWFAAVVCSSREPDVDDDRDLDADLEVVESGKAAHFSKAWRAIDFSVPRGCIQDGLSFDPEPCSPTPESTSTCTTVAHASDIDTASSEPLLVDEEGVLGATDTLARDTVHEASRDFLENIFIASRNIIVSGLCVVKSHSGEPDDGR